MLSYTPHDANNNNKTNNNFNANLLSVSSSKLAQLQFKKTQQAPPTPHHLLPPPLTTHTRTTSAFLSSLLLNAYNQNQNQNQNSKDLIKNSSLLQTSSSSTYCTNNNSTANAAFINKSNTTPTTTTTNSNNLSQVKISKKKPLHIVQDEQRLTINLMSHPAPSTSSFYNNNTSLNSKKQAFAASMPSSLIVNNNNNPTTTTTTTTPPIIISNDANNGALIALNQNAVTPPSVITKNKLTKKQSSSSSRLCLFNRLRLRNKSNDNTPSIEESNLKAYDYKAKKLDLVKTLATSSDNVRLKDFILKHLRQLSNEEQQHDTAINAKKLIKTGVKTKTNNLRAIISEAGENWTHYYMPIILIGDLNVNKSTKKMIDAYESTANLYKNTTTKKAILFNESSTVNDTFNISPLKSIAPLNDFNLSDAEEKKKKVFNLNIEQSFRPLTMSTVSQTNSNNRIYSSIASSTNKENIPCHSEKTTIVNKHISILNSTATNKKQSFAESSNRTSHDDEDKMFKSVSTSISYNGAANGGNCGSASSNTGSSEPSDPEQSNHRLMALKNEIDKTMNEINSFKNEVSFRIQSAVESLTQFDYVKFMQTSSNSNGYEALKHNKGYSNSKNNKFPNIDIPTNFTNNNSNNNTVTIDTGVNTDISMSNAIFKIKYEDDEEEMSDEHLKHTPNENNEFDDDDDDNDVSIGDLIDEDEETDNKSFYSNNSQRSKGKFVFSKIFYIVRITVFFAVFSRHRHLVLVLMTKGQPLPA
jgi:hypothetical protein